MSTVKYTKVPILEKAQKAISTTKPEQYGTAKENFQNTADILRVLVRARYGVDIAFTADFIALMMAAALKGAREAHKHIEDTVVDMAGYTGLIEQVLE